MKQRITLRQLKALLRLETGLVALVVVLTMVGFSLSQQATKSRAEQVGLNRRLATVTQNLTEVRSNDPKPALRRKLEELQAKPQPQTLPSLQQASELGPALVIYAASQGLQLNTFDTVQTLPPAAVPAGGSPGPTAGSPREKGEHLAISYLIEARGPVDSLVGALQLTGGFPTAKVQKLEFTRAPGGQPLWQMNLDLAVFYGN
jgi:hypothetical protein